MEFETERKELEKVIESKRLSDQKAIKELHEKNEKVETDNQFYKHQLRTANSKIKELESTKVAPSKTRKVQLNKTGLTDFPEDMDISMITPDPHRIKVKPPSKNVEIQTSPDLLLRSPVDEEEENDYSVQTSFESGNLNSCQINNIMKNICDNDRDIFPISLSKMSIAPTVQKSVIPSLISRNDDSLFNLISIINLEDYELPSSNVTALNRLKKDHKLTALFLRGNKISKECFADILKSIRTELKDVKPEELILIVEILSATSNNRELVDLFCQLSKGEFVLLIYFY